jgi:hypothetical protein
MPLASTHTIAIANVRSRSSGWSLEQAVQAFQDAQDAEGFTRKTQISYAKVLVLLVQYLRTTHQVEEIAAVTPEHLRQWLIDQRHAECVACRILVGQSASASSWQRHRPEDNTSAPAAPRGHWRWHA